MQPESSRAVRLLQGRPRQWQLQIIGQHRAMQTKGAVGDLLAYARHHRTESPSVVVEWASLAWYAATHHQGPESESLQALALAELGNARRLLGQWGRAEVKFARATELVEDAKGSPVAMEVYLLLASLAIQREQWVRAHDALRRANRVAEDRGDTGARIRVLQKQGIIAKELGRYEEALGLFHEACRTAGESRPAEKLRSLHNAVSTYVDGGWYDAAAEIHGRIAHRYQDASPHLQAQGTWIEGRIECGLGHWSEGADALTEARQAMEGSGYSWELAEILCDEAEARLRLGELAEVGALARPAEAAYTAMELRAKAREAASLLRAAEAWGIVALMRLRAILREQRSGVTRRG